MSTTPTVVTPMPSASGGGTTSLPSARVDGDLILLFTESTPSDSAVAAPAGFTEAPFSPVSTPTASEGARLGVFWAWSEDIAGTTISVANPGDHRYSVTMGLRGLTRDGDADPWEDYAVGFDDVQSTLATLPGPWTFGSNRLIVMACARGNDLGDSEFSGWANTDLENIHDDWSDGGTTSGVGGGLAVTAGDAPSAGPIADTTVNITSSVRKAFVQMAFSDGTTGPTRATWDGDGSDSWDGDGSDSWDGGGVVAPSTTSPYPIAVVELALGHGPLELLTDADWTNFSTRFRGLHTDRGRAHELNRTASGTGWVRFANRDRHLDPFNPASPYSPDLVPMCPIRIRARVGSTYYPIMRGFITDFGQSWSPRPIAGLGDGEVQVSFMDALGYFSLVQLNSYPDAVLADSPAGYWRLNDPQTDTYDPKTGVTTAGGVARNYGSVNETGVTGTSFDLIADLDSVTLGVSPGPLASAGTVCDFVGGEGVTPLSQDLIRGDTSTTAPPDWQSSAVYFPGERVSFGSAVYVALVETQEQQPDKSLTSWALSGAFAASSGAMWGANAWSFWADPDTLTPGDGIAGLYEYTEFPATPGVGGGIPSATAWRIYVDASGTSLVIEWSSGYVLRSVTGPAGLLEAGAGWQEISISADSSGGLSWYRKGLLFGTTESPGARDPEYPLNLAALVIGATELGGQGFDGRLAEFAVYPDPLPAARVAAHFLARADGLGAATADIQIGQILDAIGWPTDLRDIGSSSTLMQPLSPSGSALDLLLQIGEDSEQGLVQAGADGTIVFRSRSDLVNAGSPLATFGDGAGETNYADVTIPDDDQDLYTIVEVARSGGADCLAFDAGAITRFGDRALPPKTGLAFDSDDDALDCAHWLLARYDAPRERPSSVTFELGSDAALSAAVLGREIHGEPVLLNRRPPGGGLKSIPCQIEGVIDDAAPGANPPWQRSFALVPPVSAGFWTIGLSRIGIDSAFGW